MADGEHSLRLKSSQSTVGYGRPVPDCGEALVVLLIQL